MKNQYFGDINDYRKYGLLRLIAKKTGLKIGICWMLTPDDGLNREIETEFFHWGQAVEFAQTLRTMPGITEERVVAKGTAAAIPSREPDRW